MILENDVLYLEVCQNGGEIRSLNYKKKNLEVMWQGSEDHWKGKNPTLFPIVGNTYTKDYQIDGKTYAMKNHGLIRYATLNCIKKSQSEITMELKSDETTLRQYPFDFTYQIKYKLINNRVIITYQITNDSNVDMPFTFGLHSGFNVSDFNQSVLKYACPEKATQIHIKDNVYEEEVELNEWHLSHEEIESASTIIYKNLKSPYVDLEMPEYSIRMSIEGYPFFAIWSSDKDAPFICLEPWYGHADFVPSNESFENREGMMKLSPNQSFMTSYWFEINE